MLRHVNLVLTINIETSALDNYMPQKWTNLINHMDDDYSNITVRETIKPVDDFSTALMPIY